MLRWTFAALLSLGLAGVANAGEFDNDASASKGKPATPVAAGVATGGSELDKESPTQAHRWRGWGGGWGWRGGWRGWGYGGGWRGGWGIGLGYGRGWGGYGLGYGRGWGGYGRGWGGYGGYWGGYYPSYSYYTPYYSSIYRSSYSYYTPFYTSIYGATPFYSACLPVAYTAAYLY